VGIEISIKKWRTFRGLLKVLYYKAELSRRQNIENGCQNRIPDDQWEYMVDSYKKEQVMVSTINVELS
jgi:hypothetical protein